MPANTARPTWQSFTVQLQLFMSRICSSLLNAIASPKSAQCVLSSKVFAMYYLCVPDTIYLFKSGQTMTVIEPAHPSVLIAK